MSAPAAKPERKPRVELAVTRTVQVLGDDDRPAVELTLTKDKVTLALLPRNGSRRSPVRLIDLVEAVRTLNDA